MKRLLRVLRFLPVLLVVVLLGVSCGTSLDPEEKAAIAEIAAYTNRSLPVDAALRELGYQPPADESEWRQLSALRKVETAFHAAEAGTPGVGGTVFLARMSRNQAQKYDGVKQEPALATYLKLPDSGESLHFAESPVADGKVSLPVNVRDAIVVLADYTSRSPVGTQREILTRYCGLSDADAIEFLRTRTYQNAIHDAIARKEADKRHATVVDLTHAVATHYEAARSEAALKPFLSGWTPPPPPAPPRPPPDQPQSGGPSPQPQAPRGGPEPLVPKGGAQRVQPQAPRGGAQPQAPLESPPPRSPAPKARKTCMCEEYEDGRLVRRFLISEGEFCGRELCQ